MMHTVLFGLGPASLYLYSLCHHLICGSSRFLLERLLRIKRSLARLIAFPIVYQII